MNSLEAFEMMRRVISRYPIKGEIAAVNLIPTGHINDTFCVAVIENDAANKYIAQRINTYVFKKPDQVMKNIQTVAQYLDKRGIKEKCDIRRYINALDGNNYVVEDGCFWRLCRYVENSVSYDTVENEKVLTNAGYAFGRFQAMLAGLPMDSLYETIPDFHNTRVRMDNLFRSYEKNEAGRAGEVAGEMEFFAANRALCSRLVEMLEAGELPLRVTHNDTKYNNILMDRTTGEPLCVIDLDTIMPGLSLYDFGDAIRFAANTAAEDETDLDKVSLNMDYFKAFTKGFLAACGDSLTKNELDNLALGAFVITAEIASRFLADYLDGDKYFHIHRPKHNLERARCQIRLAQDMLSKLDKMREAVYSFVKN
ncbi:MAG: aminoglycoside phosphotransferase family protein [Clostridia bacterium]|nr:aminoglycoside phosphotransferase family protein [Clostridia bacterium]